MNEPLLVLDRLVLHDFGCGLLPPDVLLASLQCEDIASLARGVYRLADDPTRHAPDVLGACRDEAVVRAAERLEVAGALPFADRDRAAVASRRLEDAEGHRVDMRDRQRARFARGRG